MNLQRKTRQIQRGDIYCADLSPVDGSEQGGNRPVLVIQNNTGNHFSPTVIAAAITGHTKRDRQPTHVRINHSTCGLFQNSTVLLEQIRTLDKRRLREHMGRVDETMMKQVDTAIAVSFGLHPDTMV